MAKVKTIFECEACGNQQSKWMGKCPGCGAWESFVELSSEQIKAIKEISKPSVSTANAKPITQIEIEKISRQSTGDAELDLVLGGGVVNGSLVLIGGSPGIGKSTLLLKIGSNLANSGEKVLYVSGEESSTQI
ncbi:ATPase domain-containing protein, partial [Campylobacter fetus]